MNEPDIDDGNIRIEAELASNSIPFGKTVIPSGQMAPQNGTAVDSLRITGLKLMVAEIKLHRSGGGEEKVVTGPALLSIDRNGVRAVIAGTVQAGTIDKVNFKFHRLNNQEIGPFVGDADFDEFTTDERITIIVEGIAYDGGQAFPFTYGSKVESDLTFDLDDFTVTGSDVTIIFILLDPISVFKDKDTRQVMDPRD